MTSLECEARFLGTKGSHGLFVERSRMPLRKKLELLSPWVTGAWLLRLLARQNVVEHCTDQAMRYSEMHRHSFHRKLRKNIYSIQLCRYVYIHLFGFT